MSYILKGPDGNPILRNDKEIYAQDFTGEIKSVNLEKRTLTIIGTDETRDRDGDIIRVNGWMLENYLKNPVFLWAHNYSSVPLGATSQIIRRRNPGRLEFKDIRFPTEGLNPFADMILQLYQQGIINASSVGFLPYKWQELEKSETADEEPPMWKWGIEFIKQELLELSGCPVPSNPSALQNAIKNFTQSDILTQNLLNCFDKGIENLEHKDDILGELNLKREIDVIYADRPLQIQVIEQIETSEEEKEVEEFLKDSEEVSEEELKPYPNEHACRLVDPSNFSEFRRGKRNHEGKEYSVIYGKKSGEDSWAQQAFRYNKDTWTVSEARSHCKNHDGSFEAALGASVDLSEACVREHYSKEFDLDLSEKEFTVKETREVEGEEGKVVVSYFAFHEGKLVKIKEETLDKEIKVSEGEGETKQEFSLSQADKEWLVQTIKEIVQANNKEEVPAAKAPQEPETEIPNDPSELEAFKEALGRLKKVANEIEEVVKNATY
jgi:hypothetical protein